jgi:enoyl-CoA hydratase/carnithine racemase
MTKRTELAFETLRVTRHGEIEDLVLHRADKLNSLNPALIRELREYFRGVATRMDCRVILLRGAGPTFCAGGDLSDDAAADTEGKIESTLSLMDSLADIILGMRRCPQPIIALLQGAAAGGGMAIALAADARVAAPAMRLVPSFLHVGSSAGEMGLTYLLPRLVGRSIAAEILLAGRSIDAERALRLGLVSELVDEERLWDAGISLASDMLRSSPLGLRMSKDLLNINQDAPSLEAAMAAENRTQVLCSQTDYVKEGIAAFLEKRAPDYRRQRSGVDEA